ncbi:MAG: ribonuclease R [Gemmatimonadetes bacterium]|nr:ribonuclease R [Gemmatimonadota bacterium]
MPVEPGAILEYLRRRADRPLRAGELAAGLGVNAEQLGAFRALLDQLEDAGVLYRVQRERYAAPDRINLAVGRISTTRKGAGFVAPEDGGPDVYVAADALQTAQDGDRVVVRLERGVHADRPEGRVIRVLARGRATIVGSYHERRGARGRPGFVTPQDPRFRWDVAVPAGEAGAAADGDVVVVRITDWGSAYRGPEGSVERVLGRIGDPGVDVASIIHGHELPLEFPPEAEVDAAALLARGVTAEELAARQDFRAQLVFTIDPVDARDHDDALSIRAAADGLWEVGVHIADVSWYVRPGSPLDLEALRRGTSIYLVDRVIPMLPHPLSSDLCSLQPGVDRLTLSLLLTLDGAARVRRQRLVRGVIRSRHRLAYEQAQAALDGTAGIDPETDAALRQLLTLSRALRAQRQERGSLDFDLPEARMVLNAWGEPTDIQRRERLEAHRLIEDFMLLANETIAQLGAAARSAFIYRIHEKPDEARLEQLRAFLATLGYRLGPGSPRDLQRVLVQAEGRPDETLVGKVVLRAMKQARYSEENSGHFGLAARCYTHFTSPIRRYPDLVVHRLCARLVLEQQPAGMGRDTAAEVAHLASERERVAVAAERASVDLMKAEFMSRHVGAEFEGTIASVRAFGFFVLLDAYYVEGLVHVSSLADDYYLFLEDQLALVGENSHRRFRVGDRVRILVEAVDLEERQVDFLLAAPPERRGGGRSRRSGSRG